MASWTPPEISGRPVAVLGAGLLGERIACTWVAGGYEVIIYDPNSTQIAKAAKYVNDNASTYPIRPMDTKIVVFMTVTSMKEAVKNAWLVIECVPEKLELKIDVFEQLAQIVPADAIICSNSSSYKSRELIAKADAIKTRVCNMHYYKPPSMRLVELMTDGYTEEAIFPFLSEKLKAIGLLPIRAYVESTGFIINRVWAAIKRECLTVLEEGISSPEELDAACVEMFGMHGIGPCKQMDLIGLDTVALIEDHYIKERNLPTKTVDFLRENYVDKGKLGRKSGEGLYPPSEKTEAASLFFLDIGTAAAPSDVPFAGRVLRGTTMGNNLQVLVDHQTMPDGIAVSKRTQRLFWTLMGTPGKDDGCVNSCRLDGSDFKTVIEKGSVNTLKQLIVYDDGEKEQLYFCDREGMKVRRCDLDGANLEILIDAGDFETQVEDQRRHCVGVAVSHEEQRLYWTQKGASKATQGRIFRAGLQIPSGQTASTRDDIEAVLHDLPEPIDLEIDEEGGMLYWTDRGELPYGNSINRVKLSELHLRKSAGGKQGHGYEIVARNLHEAIGLALDTKNRHVYSTDLGGSVYQCDMDADSTHQANFREVYKKQGYGAFTGIAILAE